MGRKSWLFVGSDEHSKCISHVFTLIASARRHAQDPEAYLRDMIRVVPHWPRDRYLELAPLFWKEARVPLDAPQLESEVCPLIIPEPL